ncbi:unnamed protein product [Darwinula stevensoni]|uniref:Uncharacterized protein n=1 Tax=Darwinula stevensoni TaxID=69355 RepID=A0A7R9AGX2_9CRUS|nr:unnamed protein product [Darwinula stevensoni]CAG0904533.1 unnamed protein product [Darwinula stevensoni]
MGTFAPYGEGDARWGCFLLFLEESSERKEMMGMMERMERMGMEMMEMMAHENAPWMSVEKLPPVYGNRQIPFNLEKSETIFFGGKVPVFFYHHTALILWEMDRELAGLPPLAPVRAALEFL